MFVVVATQAKCRSIQMRNAFLKTAIRKDGSQDNSSPKNLLFLRSRIEAVLTEQYVSWVLDCSCETVCGTVARDHMSFTTLAHQIIQDWNKGLNFAVLVFMGTSFAARVFFSSDPGTDNFALGRPPPVLDRPEFQQNFHTIFKTTRLLLKPPTFRLNNATTDFLEDHNFPFLFEEPRETNSSFAKMYTFWIHKDFAKDLPSIEIPEKAVLDPKKDFPDKRLARKELRGSADLFNSERRILQFMAEEKQAHIIKLLFWYRRGSLSSLVFPYYPANLQQVLEKGWLPKRPPERPDRFKGSRLRYWLWEQTLHIVDALKCVHVPNPSLHTLGRVEGLMGGHFDIKPANILIDDDGQLVLADFGQAQIKGVNLDGGTSFTIQPGTFSYQPPPTTSNNSEVRERWHRCYDVWSMACVMLEVICFILKGRDGVIGFSTARYDERELHVSAATFWKPSSTSSGGFKLKDCVLALLGELKMENDRYLRRVSELIEKMLTIDPLSRPAILKCQETLSSDILMDQWPLIDEDEVFIGGYDTVKPLQAM